MEKIVVRCRCGAKLVAPASAAGKSAPCPKCGTRNIVPPITDSDGPAIASDTADMPPVEGDGIGGAEASWERDIDLGPVPRAALQQGIIYCVVAASVVGLGWYMAAAAMKQPLVPMALGVGIAAGIAMTLGVRRKHPTCGLVSLAIATAAILGAKLVIFNSVILPELQKKEMALPNQATVNAVLTQAERIKRLEPMKMPGTDEQALENMDPGEAAAVREVEARRKEMLQQAKQNAQQAADAVKQASRQRFETMRTDLSFTSQLADCTNISVLLLALGAALLIPAIGK